MKKDTQKAPALYTIHVRSGVVILAPSVNRIDTITYGFYVSPFGRCAIGVTKFGICMLTFSKSLSGSKIKQQLRATWGDVTMTHDDKRIMHIGRSIFNSHPPQKPVALLVHGTPFQVQVWSALCGVLLGSTTSYIAIAKAIRNGRAYRAVGSACGKNRIGFLIPCHRVLASDGSLGGFGWGLPLKKKMLNWEQANT